MCISLNIRTDVSICGLMETARNQPVVRTSHVGNSPPVNLLAAQCGFMTNWVDTTIPRRDKNANPHYLIKSGEARLLSAHPALERTLTTHVRVDADHAHAGFNEGASVLDGHLAKMRSVFPAAHITYASEHFLKHRALTESVFEAATDAMPYIWYRRVAEDGALEVFGKGASTGIGSWRDVEHRVMLYPERMSGWVVPNVLSILHDLVWQSKVSGVPEVWMLSGPDMVEYLPTLVPELCLAYDALRKRIGGLHPELVIQLVPLATFRFVVRIAQRRALDTLVENLQSGSRNRQRRGELALACSDMWAATAKRSHFSQHDMRNANDLYAHPELLRMPLRDAVELAALARQDLPKMKAHYSS